MVDSNLFVGGNNAEALFWMLIGLVFAVCGFRRRGSARKRCFLAAAIVAVGASPSNWRL